MPRTGGVAGTLPDLSTLPADLSTIILVNQQRLGDTFGQAAASGVMAKLASLASRPDVNGVVIPVEGDPGVASAYDTWNANPCATDQANKVVNDITRLVVGIRNGALPAVSEHLSLANVVVVGGDDIVPMARLDDTTRVGNEKDTPTSSTSTVRTSVPLARATSSATIRTATSIPSNGRHAGSTFQSWHSVGS